MTAAWRRVQRFLRRLTGWFQPDRVVSGSGSSLMHPVSMGYTGGMIRALGMSEEQERERHEICTELAEMEALALRQLAEAQENLEKIRALQKRAGCVPLGLN